MNKLLIRKTSVEDSEKILYFIKKLAEYEKMSNDVVTTVSDIEENIFNKKFAEVLIAEIDNKAVGFALFFHNFSTFNGGPGLYLEDLFIEEEERGKGYGKELLIYLADLAIERNCKRFEWSCLDWNTPSIEFYESIGASMMKEWKIFRLSGDSLSILASKKTNNNIIKN